MYYGKSKTSFMISVFMLEFRMFPVITWARKEYKFLPATPLTILNLILHCINTFTLGSAKDNVILVVKHHAMITYVEMKLGPNTFFNHDHGWGQW